ncbi:helix-turn-helix transcriptional regulator [Myxococcaceae bacterium GXIMD 01537]
MSDELGMTIGTTARAARDALGLTQAQVAEKVNLVPLVYSRLERGKMLPSVPTLLRICDTLDISADEALGRSIPGKEKKRSEEASENLRRLITLSRKLDEKQLEALVHVAQVMRR